MVMFTVNPVIALLSVIGSAGFYITQSGVADFRLHLFFVGIFIIMTIINPLFYHNGETVLFVMNNKPVTLEALLYGAVSSASIVSILYRFHSFSKIMTSDKLLYLFGKMSPKLSLILSISLRYIPLLSQRTKKVRRTQTALGLYSDNTMIDRIKGSSRVFSIMVTWALENGIITADSMVARGCGIGKRTHFSLFSFKISDVLLILLSIFLFSITAFAMFRGDIGFSYYPRIEVQSHSPISSAAYTAYGVLTFIPIFIEAKEKIRWKYLQSRI